MIIKRLQVTHAKLIFYEIVVNKLGAKRESPNAITEKQTRSICKENRDIL